MLIMSAFQKNSKRLSDFKNYQIFREAVSKDKDKITQMISENPFVLDYTLRDLKDSRGQAIELADVVFLA